MAAAGKVLCYHNHDIEFMRMEDGSLILDLLYDNAPALQGEIDTFWVQAGGQNPACWVKKLAGRMPLLHLKDYGIHDRRRAMFPIGSGNLDWQSIVPAGEAGGVAQARRRRGGGYPRTMVPPQLEPLPAVQA